MIQGAPPPGLILLHCVSDYPAAPRDVNLRVLPALERALGVPVGFSDHTLGIEVPLAAVALGACVIEKHLTLDRDLPGPDHRASLEPGEFAEMVHGIRTVEQALGDGRKRATPTEIETARVVRKSLVAARDIAAGEVVEQDAITARRPGTGLAPSMAPFVVGLEATRPVRAGDVLSLDAFRRGPARDPGEQGGRSS